MLVGGGGEAEKDFVGVGATFGLVAAGDFAGDDGRANGAPRTVIGGIHRIVQAAKQMFAGIFHPRAKPPPGSEATYPAARSRSHRSVGDAGDRPPGDPGCGPGASFPSPEPSIPPDAETAPPAAPSPALIPQSDPAQPSAAPQVPDPRQSLFQRHTTIIVAIIPQKQAG